MALVYDSGCGSSDTESTAYSRLTSKRTYEAVGEECYEVAVADDTSAPTLDSTSTSGSLTDAEYKQFRIDLATYWWNNGDDPAFPDTDSDVTNMDLFIDEFGDVTLEEAIARIEEASVTRTEYDDVGTVYDLDYSGL